MRLLIIGGLSDAKFFSKTNPIINSPIVSKVYLFRAFGNIYSEHKKVCTAPFPNFLHNKTKGVVRAIFDLWNLAYYLFILKTGRIDIIVGIYLYPYGFYASLLSKLCKRPFILVLPGSDLKSLMETKKHLSLFKKASYFAVRGTNSKIKLMRFGIPESKIFTLHNAFEFRSTNVDFNKEKKYDLIFIGYLRALKRLDRLIKIVFELKKTHKEIACAIVGDGPEKENLIKMTSKYNLSNNIAFIPHNNNVENFLNEAKVFVLTSDSEGLPMAIIEAMSFGIPVVSSKINDIPDIIKHGENGYLVVPDNIESFIAYIKKLLNDDKLRNDFGRAAYDTIKSKYDTDFSFEAIQNKWELIIRAAKKEAHVL